MSVNGQLVNVDRKPPGVKAQPAHPRHAIRVRAREPHLGHPLREQFRSHPGQRNGEPAITEQPCIPDASIHHPPKRSVDHDGRLDAALLLDRVECNPAVGEFAQACFSVGDRGAVELGRRCLNPLRRRGNHDGRRRVGLLRRRVGSHVTERDRSRMRLPVQMPGRLRGLVIPRIPDTQQSRRRGNHCPCCTCHGLHPAADCEKNQAQVGRPTTTHGRPTVPSIATMGQFAVDCRTYDQVLRALAMTQSAPRRMCSCSVPAETSASIAR